jgi:hypothetical protein
MIAQTYAEDVMASISPATAQALGKAIGKGKKEEIAPRPEKPADTPQTPEPTQRRPAVGNIVNFPSQDNNQKQQEAA